MNAIQLFDTIYSEEDANSIFNALAMQEGFLGGRVCNWRDQWYVQVFFKDSIGHDTRYQLPDGCRRVFIPNNQKQILGIK